MNDDKKQLDDALKDLRKTQARMCSIDGGENEHLLRYALDMLDSAEGYLETFRRRLDDPEAD